MTGPESVPESATAHRDVPPPPPPLEGAGQQLPASGTAPDGVDPTRRSGLDGRGKVKRTRAATAWASAVALALVTIFFVIFVVQNSQSVTIEFLWMKGQVAAAAALLIAAVAGAFVVGIPAAVRIGQLRHSLRRNG